MFVMFRLYRCTQIVRATSLLKRQTSDVFPAFNMKLSDVSRLPVATPHVELLSDDLHF